MEFATKIRVSRRGEKEKKSSRPIDNADTQGTMRIQSGRLRSRDRNRDVRLDFFGG